MVLLILLLFAVQVSFGLYATSSVTAVAHDAARIVAGADSTDRESAARRAEVDARAALGRYGDRVRFTWHTEGEMLALRVEADNPSFLPVALRRPLSLDRVDRTIRIRLEEVR